MTKELLQQALDALRDSIDCLRTEYDVYVENYGGYSSHSAGLEILKTGVDRHEAAIAALEAALAQPVAQRVVAWMTEDGRVATDVTKQGSMSTSSKVVFNIPLYAITLTQPTIKNAELVWHIAQDKWNAQADKYNKWDSLGQDEMSVLIVREAELQLSQIVQPEQPATVWRMRAMDGQWMFCSKESYDFFTAEGMEAQQLYVKLPAAAQPAAVISKTETTEIYAALHQAFDAMAPMRGLIVFDQAMQKIQGVFDNLALSQETT